MSAGKEGTINTDVKTQITMERELILSLQLVDPLLQFLTKASGRTSVSLETLKKTIPSAKRNVLQKLPELARRGVLNLEIPKKNKKSFDVIISADNDNELKSIFIGFPPPVASGGDADNIDRKGRKKRKSSQPLHGASKTAAKRRLVFLKRSFKGNLTKEINGLADEDDNDFNTDAAISTSCREYGVLDGLVNCDKYKEYSVKEQHERFKMATCKYTTDMAEKSKNALKELHQFLDQRKKGNSSDSDRSFALPSQAAWAGSTEAREKCFGFLSENHIKMVPDILSEALGLQLRQDDKSELQDSTKGVCPPFRPLYSHQARAISKALDGKHTLIGTGTGSGKSMCFLLPILADLMNNDSHSQATSALLIFPTKALAQDQMSKLETLLSKHPKLKLHIRPGIIDGDTPHQNRAEIVSKCNLILSNPDTLHAAMLPNWRGIYCILLARLKYVVVDELHMYEGAFGAHVSLVLSRLVRVASISNSTSPNPRDKQGLVFIGCSATIGHPEEHFRLICPVAADDPVCVFTSDSDGSPCASKHFFVWNPPLLDSAGNNTGNIISPLQKKNTSSPSTKWKKEEQNWSSSGKTGIIKRSHAADESARLLAHAVTNGIRCIAFCKTRMLAEWVFERSLSILKSDQTTARLANMVDIYRGGYSSSVRRRIESNMFKGELIGIVGTSALELGIDIGGIDLTLHCGYPGSVASLTQQAGRAGRGAVTTGPSFAIMVCFSSPAEQHIWKHPKTLLGRGLDAPPSIPITQSIAASHMLCASGEFPLCGSHSVIESLRSEHSDGLELSSHNLSDHDLFGGSEVYNEAFKNIFYRRQVCQETINDLGRFKTFSIHPSIKKPFSRISLRSIEPISYSIVDLSHAKQDGRNDGIHDKAAVMDSIPYSRVFYHCFPGAIIMHRGRRYKIHSMNSPPLLASSTSCFYNCSDLGAFAKPTTAQYSTRALSITSITVVKQLNRVEIDKNRKECTKELSSKGDLKNAFVPPLTDGTIGGSGVVTVKRTVHGYKKLSLVNRLELSRSEISLPPMEYDTHAIWFDTEACALAEVMPSDYNKGVHALSHAILACAPLFIPCTTADIDCDHSHYDCTRIMLFDVRAGGAGSSNHLWKHFFRPDGVLDAAIDLLTDCPLSCDTTSAYKGGCPGCIQSVPCINFHEDLSRKAGLYIARRLLARIKESNLYKANCNVENKEASVGTLREIARNKALETAADLVAAKSSNIVVGRPTWAEDLSISNQRSTVEACEENGVVSK